MRTIGTLKYIMATLFICLMSSMPAHAQWKSDADTVKLSRWEPHMSVSTGFLGTSYGDNRLYTSVAPSLTFRPNDRWKMNAGFRITSDMGLNPNYAFSSPTRSLAPVRHRNGGTGLVPMLRCMDLVTEMCLMFRLQLFRLLPLIVLAIITFCT